MRNGRPMAMSYKTKEAKKYQEEFAAYISEQIQKQKWKLTPNSTQHFYVDCVFYFYRVDMDCNNYFKCLLDAITDTKLIWLDDNVVCERVNAIYYDTENPRVELDIYPTDYIGIFDNAVQLEQFEANCVGCTRYARNCSLLNNAKAGKIQKEIHDCVCDKYKVKKMK